LHENAFANRHILIVGDILHSRVARSNLELFTRLGGRVTFVAPPTLLPPGIDSWNVDVSYDFDATLARADFDAIMMLRIQAERMLGSGGSGGGAQAGALRGAGSVGFFPSLSEYITKYALTNERAERLRDDVAILHPAPINRGLEISSRVADSPRSLINHQIANGVYVRMAALKTLLDVPDGHAGGLGADSADVGQALKGKTVVNLFYENSTRTRFSFETAEKKLGANVVNFAVSNSSVSKGESLKDTVMTLNAMGLDAVVIRHQDSGAAFRLANSGWIDVPVLNAGDGTHAHPTQALLDAMTLWQHFGGFSQLHGTADMYGRPLNYSKREG
jgi:aspartate carbamoyltransferase catalytic subunit